MYEYVILAKDKQKKLDWRTPVVDGRGKEFVVSRDEVLLRHRDEIIEVGGVDGSGVEIVMVPFAVAPHLVEKRMQEKRPEKPKHEQVG